MSINDLTKCPGGYRIINFGEVTFSETEVNVPGTYKFLQETDHKVPLLCYIKDTAYLGVSFGASSIYVWGLGILSVGSDDTIKMHRHNAVDNWAAATMLLDEYLAVDRSVPLLPLPKTADNGKVLKIVAGKYQLVTP